MWCWSVKSVERRLFKIWVLDLTVRRRIHIAGRVQGVGCRPFVYRVATMLGLTGVVYNDTKGVVIEVQGACENIERFVDCVRSGEGAVRQPPLMEVSSCEIREISEDAGEDEFVIGTSDSAGTPVSQVTPDIATCEDCLSEMNDARDFRYGYPFINCTNCGPRYSIVRTIPYDRPNTTMGPFEMCATCGRQYADIADRRFHAQPVACGDCGPTIWLSDSSGATIETDCAKVIEAAAQMLSQGRIAAIKGIGGYHLAVDAFNDEAVRRLRERKRRDHKPFAMMALSIEVIEGFVHVDDKAGKLLQSPEAPIVLLNRKTDTPIAPSVAEGTSTLGFMLCYAPLHHLLFQREGIKMLVMTSANLSDEPLICNNDEAVEKLGGVADFFLHHNRDIYRQLDDSVVHIVDGERAFLRRSRGYVPTPILREGICADDIFAAGADLKNIFCFVKGNQLILSEHIGDLADGLVYRHYVESVAHLRSLFEIEPAVVACDLHPGYLSSEFARSFGIASLIEVQHHWAHIASVLAEYDHREKVIGIVADGTGLGTDGAIWGCECLVASLEGFERAGCLAYYPLAGGDIAAKEPIRPVLGLLKVLTGDDSYVDKYGDLLEAIEPGRSKVEMIAQQIKKNLNTVQTSSAGRLFDAVGALAGLGRYNHFEAQLPMALESILDANVEEGYGFQMKEDSEGTLVLDFRIMLVELIEDIRSGKGADIVSAKFHNFLAGAMLEFVIRIRDKSGLDTVALSGGVFCNRYLVNRLIRLLKENGFRVLFKRQVPANDGGIALGQAAIAACAVERGVL